VKKKRRAPPVAMTGFFDGSVAWRTEIGLRMGYSTAGLGQVLKTL
jgi:hypothetical protein